MALSDPFDTVARLMYDATSQFGKQGLALVEGLVEQKRKKDLLREEYALKSKYKAENPDLMDLIKVKLANEVYGIDLLGGNNKQSDNININNNQEDVKQRTNIVTPARTVDEALSRIPEGESKEDYIVKEEVRKDPLLGMDRIIYKPELKPEVQASRKKQESLRIESEDEAREANALIDSIWETADRLIPAQNTPAEAESKGIQRTLGSMSILGMRPQRFVGKSDENAIVYKDYAEGTLSLLIRRLGEKGVLNKEDIARARQLIPKFNETKEQRLQRKKELNNLLNAKINSYYKSKGVDGKTKSIRMKRPDGKIFDVPENAVDESIKKGWSQ